MSALRAKFQARCKDEAEAIDAVLRGRTDIETLIAVLHRVAGSGGSFGHPDLSERAAGLEDAVRRGELDRAALSSLRDTLISVSATD